MDDSSGDRAGPCLFFARKDRPGRPCIPGAQGAELSHGVRGLSCGLYSRRAGGGVKEVSSCGNIAAVFPARRGRRRAFVCMPDLDGDLLLLFCTKKRGQDKIKLTQDVVICY